jgi:hypothetical protein
VSNLAWVATRHQLRFTHLRDYVRPGSIPEMWSRRGRVLRGTSALLDGATDQGRTNKSSRQFAISAKVFVELRCEESSFAKLLGLRPLRSALALGMRVGALALGMRVGALALGIRDGAFAIGMRVDALALGIGVGALALGIRVGALALGIRVGALALGIRVGALALGIRVGAFALAPRAARACFCTMSGAALRRSGPEGSACASRRVSGRLTLQQSNRHRRTALERTGRVYAVRARSCASGTRDYDDLAAL